MRFTPPTFAALPLVVLAGCGATFDYDGLRDFDAQGSGFGTALSREYKALALYEADEMYDWPDAAHFGAKALAAARGPVEPERPGNWRLPSDALGAITAAHARLTAVLDGGARTRLPDTAAVAQARYDCWLEQQEENWQTDHIARCRDAFFATLGTLESNLAQSPAGEDPSPVTPAALDAGDAEAAPRAFSMFFAFDSDSLDTEAQEIVRRIAGAVGGGGAVRVLVGGHADRAGPRAYNDSLSWRRADAVRAALIAAGIDSDRIAIWAYGETRPRIATADGIRHPENRRVEITVGPAPGT